MSLNVSYSKVLLRTKKHCQIYINVIYKYTVILVNCETTFDNNVFNDYVFNQLFRKHNLSSITKFPFQRVELVT